MDLLAAAVVLALIIGSMQSRATRGRVRLLALHLHPYEIEKLMQTLSEGYQRALGEDQPQRRLAIWQLLEGSQSRLAEQVARLATDLSRLPADQALMSKLPLRVLAEPLLRLMPALQRQHTVDLRALMALHAQSLARAAAPGAAGGPSTRARTFLAEMLLLQHSCHWFCRSRALASARLLAHHQSSYEQVLESIDPATRDDYLKLMAGD
jgi:hypothetical protein